MTLPTPFYEREGIRIYVGDNREVLPHIEPVHAVVTDPPYGLSFMGKGWDHQVPGIEFWQAIMAAMLPGAHLLAFGGTRTYHRMAVAIEDAGYEIRDTLQWLYGSGFPKSHDVSKAIDKLDAADARRERQLRFTRWMRSTGLTSAHIDRLTGTNMGGHYTTLASQPAVATRDHFEALRPHITVDVPQWVEQMVDERTVESENFKRREVIGSDTKARSTSGKSALPTVGGTTVYETWDITAPATPAAEQWQGWGTALKPAYEPIIMARKPLRSSDINVLEMVYLQLRDQGVTGDIEWKSERVSGAGKRDQRVSSSSTDQPQAAGISASLVVANGTPKIERKIDRNSETITQDGEAETPNTYGLTSENLTENLGSKLSLPTVESVPVAEKENSTSLPLTTPMAGEHRTESLSTARSTTNCGGLDIQRATEFSVGIAIGPQGSTKTVRIIRDTDGLFIWPDALPKTIKGKNLTVAANVLAHGTGAINVDASRIATDDDLNGGAYYPSVDGMGQGQIYGKYYKKPGQYKQPTGRWPANVILDEAAAEALDAQSGERKSGGKVLGTEPSKPGNNGIYGTYQRVENAPYFDTGGASRFFYVAKASRRERNAGLPEGETSSHPTVKPLALMRYLIQMVTPPGGIILDPFMGSGSTLVAAAELGFNAIGIEMNEEYAEIAARRVDHAIENRDPQLTLEGIA